MKNKDSYFSKWKILVLAAAFSVLIASCGGGSSTQETESASNYRLEVFDSLQFDFLTRGLSVADVDTETGNQLIIQSSPSKVFIFNNQGKILAEKEFQRGDPEGPGASLMSATFYDGGVALLGQFNVSLFDQNLVFQKVMRPHYASQMFFGGYKHLFQFRTENGDPRLVVFFGEANTNSWEGQEKYYDEFYLVDVIDPSEYISPRDTVFKPIGGFTPDSKYRNGKAHYFPRPIFDVKDNILHYVLNNDTTFFRRSLPKGEIIESYTIPYDEFVVSEGLSMGEEGQAEQMKPRDRGGRVEKVFRVGNFDLIQYHSGLELDEMMKYINEPDPGKAINELDYLKFIIVKDGIRVNRTLDIDPRVRTLYSADEQGILYGSQNISMLENEPDKYTIYKLKIVPDDQ